MIVKPNSERRLVCATLHLRPGLSLSLCRCHCFRRTQNSIGPSDCNTIVLALLHSEDRKSGNFADSKLTWTHFLSRLLSDSH